MSRSSFSIAPGLSNIRGLDRRSFLTLAGAAALLTLGGAATARERAAATTAAIRFVVTDRRIRESVEFGDIMCSQGSIRLEVTRGLTTLWRDALLPMWRAPGGAVAGCTDLSVWKCLAEQARSHMRKSTLILRPAQTPVVAASGSLVTWVIA